ncbi:GNAT family N-acetyltransferase [Ruminococcaceae bacterium OttesenSCG-928-A16]|nr:GNAT family N-acetyltransferase [Ruminococcaceae bacterium OttesenSCG-928-A16]
MTLSFTQAGPQHAAAMLAIIEEAKAFMRQQGLPQWQNGYPNMASVEEDIAKGQAYLLLASGQPAGTLALCYEDDPTYHNITNGSWRTNTRPYAAIHRVAAASAYRGSNLAATMMTNAEAIARQSGFPSVRIDTHEQNQPMQKFLQKNGYQRCGTIYLNGSTLPDDKRIAFEKIL